MKQRSVNINSLLSKASNVTEAPRTYSNHVQFTINLNEIFIDFYRLEPTPGNPTANSPEVTLLHRMVIPIGLGKGFATGMANLIAGFEKATGLVTQNNREPDPEDVIVIWKDE